MRRLTETQEKQEEAMGRREKQLRGETEEKVLDILGLLKVLNIHLLYSLAIEEPPQICAVVIYILY